MSVINLDARQDNTPPQEVRFLRLLDKEATAFTFQTFADAEELKHRADLRLIFHGDARDDRLHQMHDAGAGIYITVNETNGRGRKSEDVVRVRAVWREADEPNLPPLPLQPSLVVESSPGRRHEYFLVSGDWPADEKGREDFDGILDRMVQSYGSDPNAKGVNRVLRLPGFLNRKRIEPHRVRMISYSGRCYTRQELLTAFPPIRKPKPSPAHFAPSGTDEIRIRDALFSVNADDRQTWLECGMALKAELGESGRSLWDSWSQTSSKYEARDQEKTWRWSLKGNGIGIGSLFHYAQAAGWRPAERNGHESGTAKPNADKLKPNGHEPATEELQSTCAVNVKMKAITWLWPDRFAVGKLGLVVGLPDEGKGQTLAYITAQVTIGGAWPMNEGTSPRGNVIVFSDEDDEADTLVPRFLSAGADLTRIHLIKLVKTGDQNRLFSLVTDLEALRKKIIEIGDVKLIIIDPISAYLGVKKIDSFRTADVRAVLTPLIQLAAEMKVAIIAVMHFNKKMDVTNALLRISDSLAFGAVARHVYGVIDDAESDRKLFVRAKNNVAAKSSNKTLAYRFGARIVGRDEEVNADIWAPYILWENAYVDVTAMEAMQAAVDNKSPAAKDEAAKLLRDMLKFGPVAQQEIKDTAEGNAISWATMRRAKDSLEIVAGKAKGTMAGVWYWKLPDDRSPWPWEGAHQEGAQGRENEHLEHLRE